MLAAAARKTRREAFHRSSPLGLVTALSFCAVLVHGEPAQAQEGYRWFTIDPPDSVRTEATGITPNGYIAGRYNATDGKRHGFVLVDETYVRIDPPGSIFTNANGINPRGEVSGNYFDSNGKRHGFLLRDGLFTTVDVPGALATGGAKLNPEGDLVGGVIGADGKKRGYILRRGEFQLIEPPLPQTTFDTMIDINADGDAVGNYFTADCASRKVHSALAR